MANNISRGVLTLGVPGFFTLNFEAFSFVLADGAACMSMTVECAGAVVVPLLLPLAEPLVLLWLTSVFASPSAAVAVVFMLFSAFSDFSNCDLSI